MKKFKSVSNVMAIIAISLFLLGIVLSTISESILDAAFFALIEINMLFIVCACVGVFLLFSKNDTVKKLGNGMAVVGFTMGLMCAASVLFAEDLSADLPKDDFAIGSILTLVSVLALVAHYAFLLVDYLLTKNSATIENPNEDVRIIRVKEWKALMEEGIITKEEYEEKRLQILGIAPKESKK